MRPAEPGTGGVAAVVLAGGASRRFGSDKLLAPLDGVPLLERTISSIPADWLLVLVGPQRRLPAELVAGRRLLEVREDPPGGGPAAGLVTGIAAALAAAATVVVTVPGDTPDGGVAAQQLTEALLEPGPASAIVGVDAAGVEQPLQFAADAATLRPLAARTDVTGTSARSLLATLGDYRTLPLSADHTADIDTQADLARAHDRVNRRWD